MALKEPFCLLLPPLHFVWPPWKASFFPSISFSILIYVVFFFVLPPPPPSLLFCSTNIPVCDLPGLFPAIHDGRGTPFLSLPPPNVGLGLTPSYYLKALAASAPFMRGEENTFFFSFLPLPQAQCVPLLTFPLFCCVFFLLGQTFSLRTAKKTVFPSFSLLFLSCSGQCVFPLSRKVQE